MAMAIIPTGSRGLLQLPPETRHRIYGFAFQDSNFIIFDEMGHKSMESLSQLVNFKTSGFPIRLIEVCQLLYEKVADYKAYHLHTRLEFDINDRQLAIQHLIPGRYRARVWHLDTSYTVMVRNVLFDIEFLPDLRSLSVHLGTTLFKSELYKFDDASVCDSLSIKISKYQNINRYLAQCYSDFEGCQTLIRYCREFWLTFETSLSSVLCMQG